MFEHNGVAKSVTVVVPARNEAQNIGWVLDNLPDYVDEVVLVDGSSVDDTIEVAREHRPDLTLVRQTRRGKGNALAAGFEAATSQLIVMIDADGSMHPAEITRFLEPLAEGADYVKGSRFVTGGGSDDITALRKAGNWGLNVLTNVLFRSRYTDLCYGYNAFTRDCVEAFTLAPAHEKGAGRYGDGFEIETMINVRVVLAGLDVVEVPSYEYLRRSGESNLNTFRDGFRVLGTILRERGQRARRLTHLPAPRPAEAPSEAAAPAARTR
ncbi:glycosyltransferase family 2 protein [Isoptericola sp. b441]|uniref:Glycosyltransferase family 2 protein n=1 Tax=Actinotalea lenta TaxID=3064654 RepID=A0ABT9D5G1_9CELL|nr:MULTISPECIES: glycosyltransferase family 2 protein [unclassified Isoptericola]MDO8106008.1 glycosyltransferase family 2 protein [Isoptericola sp. b441]MDO8122273.1 glycosyltransferase family 2 protein [Isoptericola sp. b490]